MADLAGVIQPTIPSKKESDSMGQKVLLEIARELFIQSLADCNIEQAIAKKVRSSVLESGARLAFLGENILDLTHVRQARIIAIGKAGEAMLNEVLPTLPFDPSCNIAGILVAPLKPSHLPTGFKFFAGGHPLPNEATFLAARAALALLDDLRNSALVEGEALCLFLISGGASAMMEFPLDPTITLADTIELYRILVHSGANIREINSVRKHFSAVKGGRLALAAGGAQCFSILISDVPESELDVIASGPTLPDTSTLEECKAVLRRYNITENLPVSIQRFFDSGELVETPKATHLTARAWTLLQSSDLAEAVRYRAEFLGFYTVIDNSCDDWDYASAAEYLLVRLRTLRLQHPKVCLISVGEISVNIPNSTYSHSKEGAAPPVGGRNQHFALHMATLLRTSDAPVAVLSAGSDGIDGNSTAAGAVISESTLAQAQMRECALDALQQYSSGSFLASTGSIIETGPTGTNLRDLRVLLAE
jgi:hydroxypyruvate reductase